MTMIAGVFSDVNQVQPALEELLAQHFDLDRMSVLVSEHHHRDEATVEHRDHMAAGSRIGAAVGAVLGATLVATGFLAGPGALLGVGPVLQALGGAGVGASAGTPLGAMIGLDFTDDVANLHAAELDEGAVWVGVHAESREEQAEQILRAHGAKHVAKVRG